MSSSRDAQNPILHYQLTYIFRFLLASLNIETILQESTIYRRRERLGKMTSGLGLEGVYGATIERIRAQGGDKSRLGMGALMWISYSERPLSPGELCHALAIELDSTDFNTSNIPSISTLVSCCQGLITVDKRVLEVRLIHFTLQEYFSTHPDIFSRPHSVIAEICLTYLNSRQVKAISQPSETTSDSYTASDDALDWDSAFNQDETFLEYCSRYWGNHARKELSDCPRSLALELFRQFNGHISGALLLQQEPWCFPSDGYRSFNGIDCASFLGIVEIVAALMETGCFDLDEGGYQGCTPLSWAAMGGHVEVVTILLRQEEVNPDKPNNYGRTPFSYAAAEGHREIMKILLGREEVDPEKPDNEGRTPLSWAAASGREEAVKILLGWEGVSPDKPDNNGQTPLSHAARSGCEAVAKILLEGGEVNPDEPDNNGRTPLSYAAECKNGSYDASENSTRAGRGQPGHAG